ncbi:hypothetical protein PR048_007674 [Dryococelus australis]|uniref:Uncharacterized protein n=1 Tax=Dryococelus australis TaxID=614101 RepID=A0ABQ9HVB1_9NEOP|nr:hypothetical protein PR048_007674 [Dryococelus australis]
MEQPSLFPRLVERVPLAGPDCLNYCVHGFCLSARACSGGDTNLRHVHAIVPVCLGTCSVCNVRHGRHVKQLLSCTHRLRGSNHTFSKTVSTPFPTRQPEPHLLSSSQGNLAHFSPTCVPLIKSTAHDFRTKLCVRLLQRVHVFVTASRRKLLMSSRGPVHQHRFGAFKAEKEGGATDVPTLIHARRAASPSLRCTIQIIQDDSKLHRQTSGGGSARRAVSRDACKGGGVDVHEVGKGGKGGLISGALPRRHSFIMALPDKVVHRPGLARLFSGLIAFGRGQGKRAQLTHPRLRSHHELGGGRGAGSRERSHNPSPTPLRSGPNVPATPPPPPPTNNPSPKQPPAANWPRPGESPCKSLPSLMSPPPPSPQPSFTALHPSHNKHAQGGRYPSRNRHLRFYFSLTYVLTCPPIGCRLNTQHLSANQQWRDERNLRRIFEACMLTSQKRNGIAVLSMSACSFSHWLCEALGTVPLLVPLHQGRYVSGEVIKERYCLREPLQCELELPAIKNQVALNEPERVDDYMLHSENSLNPEGKGSESTVTSAEPLIRLHARDVGPFFCYTAISRCHTWEKLQWRLCVFSLPARLYTTIHFTRDVNTRTSNLPLGAGSQECICRARRVAVNVLTHQAPCRAFRSPNPLPLLPVLGFSQNGNRAGRCRWSAGFLGDLPFPPPLHFGAQPYSPHFTLIGSQDLDVERRPNLFTRPPPFVRHPCRMSRRKRNALVRPTCRRIPRATIELSICHIGGAEERARNPPTTGRPPYP